MSVVRRVLLERPGPGWSVATFLKGGVWHGWGSPRSFLLIPGSCGPLDLFTRGGVFGSQREEGDVCGTPDPFVTGGTLSPKEWVEGF